ncbi:MAG: (2Fe-2S)-binding protein [Bdellovibrionales bacterium]|nr:(2Fe-2S)-binding protein [Bdellovibrionales bacterium]
MSKVPVVLNGVSFEAEEGQTLLKAASEAGVGLAHLCFGNAICSTCRVKVADGAAALSPKTTKETVSLNYHLCFDENTRLACQAKVVGPGPILAEAPAPFSWIAPKNKTPKK